MEPNPRFGQLADDAALERARMALVANGIEAMIVESGAAAREEVLKRVPAGARVFTMSSQTLKTTGIAAEIDESGRYESVRKTLTAMDPAKQAREKRMLGAAPDWALGSVHAVTESGHLFIASNTGSQLAAYVSGAEHVLFVVGAQKIVADDTLAVQRLREYSMPLEDQRMFTTRGIHSSISKMLVFYAEKTKGRVSVVLVKEKLGF